MGFQCISYCFYLELFGGGADLLAQGDRQDLIDNKIRLQNGKFFKMLHYIALILLYWNGAVFIVCPFDIPSRSFLNSSFFWMQIGPKLWNLQKRS